MVGPEERVEVRSLYGARTQQALVTLAVGEHMVTMTPTKAREIGLMLLEQAETAEQDAFMVQFFRRELQATEEAVAAVVAAFRKARTAPR